MADLGTNDITSFAPALLSGLLLLGCSAASAGQQVDVRAGLEERIGRGLDAVDSWDGIKDDALLLGGVVGSDCRQTDFAES